MYNMIIIIIIIIIILVIVQVFCFMFQKKRRAERLAKFGWYGGGLHAPRLYGDGFAESKWFPFRSKGDALVWMYFCAYNLSRAAFTALLAMWTGTGEDRVTFVSADGMLRYIHRTLPLLEVHTHSVRNVVRVRKKGKKRDRGDNEFEYKQVQLGSCIMYALNKYTCICFRH
jgi:hypothetical protein